jgi:hypothetical protein
MVVAKQGWVGGMAGVVADLVSAVEVLLKEVGGQQEELAVVRERGAHGQVPSLLMPEARLAHHLQTVEGGPPHVRPLGQRGTAHWTNGKRGRLKEPAHAKVPQFHLKGGSLDHHPGI